MNQYRPGSFLARSIAASLFITVSIALLEGCSDGEDLPSAESESTKEASPDSTFEDPNQFAGDVAGEVPGFAGFWLEQGAPDTYVINSTVADINVEAVKDAIVERDPSLAEPFESANFRVELVHFDSGQLNAWFQEMVLVVVGELPDEYRPYLGFWDLDEAHNQVIISFTSEEARAWAEQQIAREIDAPAGAVVAILDHPSFED